MKHPMPIAAALTAAMLLAGTGPARALTSDEESACGSILCLLGGSGVAECAGHLARYFAITASNPAELVQRRHDYLSLCPATDLPGDVLPMLANYGATCQPPQLVNDLNQQIRTCEAQNVDHTMDCRPTGQEWRVCAPFYDNAYTTYQAPQLHDLCAAGAGVYGYLGQGCYVWTLAGEAPPTWDPTAQSGVTQAP